MTHSVEKYSLYYIMHFEMEKEIGKRKLHLNAPQSLQLTDRQRA